MKKEDGTPIDVLWNASYRSSAHTFRLAELLREIDDAMDRAVTSGRRHAEERFEKFWLSDDLLHRVVELSRSLGPEGDAIASEEKPLSPERGQLLKSLIAAGVDLKPLSLRSIGRQSCVDFTWADLSGLALWRQDLSGLLLFGAKLRGASLIEADLSESVLSTADLCDADLSLAKLCSADLEFADFSAAKLFGANLANARLTRAKLIGANLREADLQGARMFDADLGRADLATANLAGADLTGADLSRADLRFVDLQGVRGLRQVGSLKLANLHGAQRLDRELAVFARSQGAVELELTEEWESLKVYEEDPGQSTRLGWWRSRGLAKRKRCLHCAEWIKKEATACPYCKRDQEH
jgi:uncharacterized protein YjbI with pentapeptide repeats